MTRGALGPSLPISAAVQKVREKNSKALVETLTKTIDELQTAAKQAQVLPYDWHSGGCASKRQKCKQSGKSGASGLSAS